MPIASAPSHSVCILPTSAVSTKDANGSSREAIMEGTEKSNKDLWEMLRRWGTDQKRGGL